MQVDTINVNAANLTVGRSMMGATGVSGISEDGNFIPEQNQTGGNPFGPACKVTISEEGKTLSRQQGVKQEKNVQSTAHALEKKMLRRLSEATEEGKTTNKGLLEELDEIDKQILALNSSHDRKSMVENDPVAKEAIEQQLKLREALKRQKEFQQEESQRLAKEAGEASIKSGKYQQEIDENNRDLVTLLKTIEESEKSEQQKEGGMDETEFSSEGNLDNRSVEVSPFKKEATRFMTSSIKQELDIADMFNGLEGTANWFIDTANSVAQSVLDRSAGIRAAMIEGSFSGEEIAGMVEKLQSNMSDNYQMVEDYRGVGLYMQDELRTTKINHLGDNPMRGAQVAKEAVQKATAAAVLGEVGQSALDGTSNELTDEVMKLVERRNNPDRASKEEEDSRRWISNTLDFLQKIGYGGDELIDKTARLYDEYMRILDIVNQQNGIKLHHNEPTEEDMAAARKLISEIGKKPDFRIPSLDATKIHELYLEDGQIKEYKP